ncbi:hypothetical protein [Jiangella alkaliphila]|uniref:Uncharacterized protein n=1 Tax=Jiangella alkaliphila TaxID=419479 RepID=A0A1H2L5N1_9ACTN|nr:hypothetical protein [Jiangella alkaliphila]SDU75868.1 hypothetical protein SAMN04488563_5054 [Jiangella alkaliphila]
MTNTHAPAATLPIDDQEVHERRIPRQRTRTGFDDEIARLIRDRVQADLAKRSARKHRHREERDALERRRRYAKALHAEKLAAMAQRTCRCAQPRPAALLGRDPGGGTSVLALCPVCGRRT